MASAEKPAHFLENIIAADLAANRVQQVVTRFPPEPNGYLHIGHAKSICLNFGLAESFGGQCNLRFDDTNPEKESQEFVDSIKRDVEWLGYRWSGDARYTSDYFEKLYEWAKELIRAGNAYVCELSPDQAREYRGTLTTPGRNSPWRDRETADNLELFEQMYRGEHEQGSLSLRAKIDMAHGNINMRDPVLYRIRKVVHHHTGDRWNIYPSYDYAHGQSDAIEGVTHSICTLEFEDHRPLYNWLIENLPVPAQPKQYEFARLNPSYTVTSKRKLRALVEEGYVDGWDDPRMLTLAGMRRRGIPPQAIRNFCDMIGVTKANSVVDIAMFEFAIRDYLDKNAPRAMCVLEPLEVILENWTEGEVLVDSPNHPNDECMGSRKLPFGKTLFIEREDFREEANKKYKRLVLGKRVRLRNACVIEATKADKDEQGNVTRVYANVIEDTFGKNPADEIKPKGVIHWVSEQSKACEVRLYDRLFLDETPDAGGKDYLQCLNPESVKTLTGSRVESNLENAVPEKAYQFERQGYFCRDSVPEKLVFNRVIGLRDSWAKIESEK
jgi:glutaminyl-tRNA synthetase